MVSLPTVNVARAPDDGGAASVPQPQAIAIAKAADAISPDTNIVLVFLGLHCLLKGFLIFGRPFLS
jgi:hypothetical protein